jgi:hypothetical protein
VPEAAIVLVGGIPTSPYVPHHECPSGAPDIEERGAFDAELRTTKPAYSFKIVL